MIGASNNSVSIWVPALDFALQQKWSIIQGQRVTGFTVFLKRATSREHNLRGDSGWIQGAEPLMLKSLIILGGSTPQNSCICFSKCIELAFKVLCNGMVNFALTATWLLRHVSLLIILYQ